MSTSGAFFRRDARVAISYRLPFVMEAVSAFMILLILFYLGKLVPGTALPGGYFAFATAGIALLAFAQAGLSVVSANFRQEQVQGTLEVLLSAGISTRRLATGMVAYPMAFAIGRVALYTALGAAMGAGNGAGNWSLALAAVALGALSFAGLGLVAAALVVTVRQAGAAVALLVLALSMGGTTFPRSLLPHWANVLAGASPLTRALDITRAALFQGATWSSRLVSLGVLTILAVLSVALGVGALALALRRARRRGGLGEY